METCNLGDLKTWRPVNLDTCRLGDLEIKIPRKLKTWKHGDIKVEIEKLGNKTLETLRPREGLDVTLAWRGFVYDFSLERC